MRAHDAFLGKWARGLRGRRGRGSDVALVPGSGTADVRGTPSARLAMWRRHPDARAKSPVSEAYLDEAEADATELLPLIRTATPIRRGASWRVGRTLWSDLYNHILRVGRFLGGDGVVVGHRAAGAPAREPDAEATTPATAASGDDGHATA
ncbi:MAG: hypothetical protein U1F43_38750 [Myxococcota bacterium]